MGPYEIARLWNSATDKLFYAHVIKDVSGVVLAVDEASMLQTMSELPVTVVDHPTLGHGIAQWLGDEGVMDDLEAALDSEDATFEQAIYHDGGIWWYAPEWVFEGEGN